MGRDSDLALDILRKRALTLALFGLPILAIAGTGLLHLEHRLLSIVWTISLVIMGVTCLVNARNCGRIHCYFTGPFFLLIALITMLAGIGVRPLSGSEWEALSATESAS